MKKKIAIAFCSTILFLGGCSKKSERSEVSATSKPKASEKASENPESPESTEQVKTPESSEGTTENTPEPILDRNVTSSSDPSGTYQISSYDNGSGNREIFTPGKDTSIMGSSSVVLNKDGTCQFNLPGMSSEGCTWKGTQINASGAQITYSLNGDEMTVSAAGSTYVFQRKK